MIGHPHQRQTRRPLLLTLLLVAGTLCVVGAIALVVASMLVWSGPVTEGIHGGVGFPVVGPLMRMGGVLLGALGLGLMLPGVVWGLRHSGSGPGVSTSTPE